MASGPCQQHWPLLLLLVHAQMKRPGGCRARAAGCLPGRTPAKLLAWEGERQPREREGCQVASCLL
eukprot:656315-Rhodomonas_salina.1